MLSCICLVMPKNTGIVELNKSNYNNRMMPWDYRWFELDNVNALFKGEIELIEDGYAPFWFD